MGLELYGTKSCPYTRDVREDLEWKGAAFVEYDVENDEAAMSRLAALCGMPAGVPVLVEDGRVISVGANGRSCYVTPK